MAAPSASIAGDTVGPVAVDAAAGLDPGSKRDGPALDRSGSAAAATADRGEVCKTRDGEAAASFGASSEAPTVDGSAASLTRAVKASPGSSADAVDPSCAEPTPASPGEARGAAVVVRMPNMIALRLHRRVSSQTRPQRQSNPCANPRFGVGFRHVAEFNEYFRRLRRDTPPSWGHFCRPRALETQFLPTSPLKPPRPVAHFGRPARSSFTAWAKGDETAGYR
jgi:hypothetical protein